MFSSFPLWIFSLVPPKLDRISSVTSSVSNSWTRRPELQAESVMLRALSSQREFPPYRVLFKLEIVCTVTTCVNTNLVQTNWSSRLDNRQETTYSLMSVFSFLICLHLKDGETFDRFSRHIDLLIQCLRNWHPPVILSEHLLLFCTLHTIPNVFSARYVISFWHRHVFPFPPVCLCSKT